MSSSPSSLSTMCGNLGLLLLGRDGDAALADPAACIEQMARVVAMRGAQSYGFFCASPRVMSMHKAVLRKRGDIASSLAGAARRKMGAGVLARQRPLLLGAHLRFATSSRSVAREAHPH